MVQSKRTQDGRVQVMNVDWFLHRPEANIVSGSIDLSSANATQGDLTLQLDGLAHGIYLLRLEQGGVWATRKVIIR